MSGVAFSPSFIMNLEEALVQFGFVGGRGGEEKRNLNSFPLSLFDCAMFKMKFNFYWCFNSIKLRELKVLI